MQLQQDLQTTYPLLRENKVNTFSVLTEVTTQVYVVQLSVFFLSRQIKYDIKGKGTHPLVYNKII